MGELIGTSIDGIGVLGTSTNSAGVKGDSQKFDGVQGFSKSFDHSGVVGTNTIGVGVLGQSDDNDGVRGFSKHFDRSGVVGTNTIGVGVLGQSDDNDGVRGFSKHQDRSGVVGTNTGSGMGVLAQSTAGIGLAAKGGRLAAFFDGVVEVTGDIRLAANVEVTGDIRLAANANDCAEDFHVARAESIEPGTVMVLGEEGILHQSHQAYDKRVAGVISGAGGYKPGIVLDRQQSQGDRKPIALLGKVYCKVDAQYGAIDVGDLLTTSPTSGHAMKTTDPLKAFGAVIGKALRPLKEGQG